MAAYEEAHKAIDLAIIKKLRSIIEDFGEKETWEIGGDTAMDGRAVIDAEDIAEALGEELFDSVEILDAIDRLCLVLAFQVVEGLDEE